MSLSLADFRRLLRKGLGNLDSDDLTDDEADELLNLSLWDIEDQFPFELKKDEVTTELATDQYQYDLGSISLLDSIRSVAYVDEYGQSRPLERMTRQTYDELFNSGSVNDPAGYPEKYMREGNVLTIWPPPAEALNELPLVVAIREGITNLTNTGSNLPRNWDQIILQGAIALGHFFRQDYGLFKEAENAKIAKIRGMVMTESKEEEDSRYAGLQVAWDKPSKKTSSKFPTG